MLNKPVKDKDGFFASQKEHTRWHELQMLEKAGHIKELRRQVPYHLTIPDRNGKPFTVETYIADFTYFEAGGHGEAIFVVEDSKGGVRTPDFIRKKKWMEAVYGLVILETGLTFRKAGI